jgi:hypothetical protein
MSLVASNLEYLQFYLKNVMDASANHGETVGGVALAVIGAVLWRKDPLPIKVRSYQGNPAKTFWVQMGGDKYAVTYNHRKRCIELRQRTQTGRVLANFNNRTTMTEVYRFFKKL